MITSDEARELAAPHWGAVSSDLPPVDPTIPPSTGGGAPTVIDKETGEITSWPDISSTGVIEMYREAKRGKGRRL